MQTGKMYELTVITGFSAAHNLRGYEGTCENLHGHNWRVEVTVLAERLDSIGMAIDFKVIKTETGRIVKRLDHVYLNETPPFDKLNPTAENLARHIHTGLSKALNDGNVRVSRVTVWESEKSAAAYYD